MASLTMYVRVFISLQKILGKAKLKGNLYWVFEINKLF